MVVITRDTPDPWVLCAVDGFNHAVLRAPVPLLGPPHIDEGLGFIPGWAHVHVDWRRVPEDQYQAAAATGQHDRIDGSVGESGLCLLTLGADGLSYSQCFMPVLRPHPPCIAGEPSQKTPRQWFVEFERRYAGQRLDGCQRCPHQGISLAGARLDRDGRRQCPGHGLSFSSRGICVPRFGKGVA